MSGQPVSIYEAKTQLSKLVARVLGGEEVVIARSGVPVARLVPIQSQAGARRPGSATSRTPQSSFSDRAFAHAAVQRPQTPRPIDIEGASQSRS